MNHLELFSGIGGFRRAMDLLTQDGVMDFQCVGFSEIDSKALLTYKTNYDTNGEVEMGDIAAFTADEQRMFELPQFDLLTGGFPCQTFSMMGGQTGFEKERNDRGQMFFRIMDIAKRRRPHYMLLENVKNLSSHDSGNTIRVIENELEKNGYIVHRDIFNSCDYGLPQKRNRTLIFARWEEDGEFEFTSKLVKVNFDYINRDHCSLLFFRNTLDILAKQVAPKYYLSEKVKPTILSDGSAGFKSNSEINLFTARPLTASMHKMHRACQDNYYSQTFIDSDGQINDIKVRDADGNYSGEYLSKAEQAKLSIRKLTPQEAFLLQGFPAEFATTAQAANVADGALYKQAGNAVSVNTIYAALYYLITNNIIQG